MRCELWVRSWFLAHKSDEVERAREGLGNLKAALCQALMMRGFGLGNQNGLERRSFLSDLKFAVTLLSFEIEMQVVDGLLLSVFGVCHFFGNENNAPG